MERILYSTSSFSTAATENGGFRMSVGDLITLILTGSTNIDVYWVDSHSAGAI